MGVLRRDRARVDSIQHDEVDAAVGLPVPKCRSIETNDDGRAVHALVILVAPAREVEGEREGHQDVY